MYSNGSMQTTPWHRNTCFKKSKYIYIL